MITLVEVTQLVADLCVIFLGRAKAVWDNYIKGNSSTVEMGKNKHPINNNLQALVPEEESGDRHFADQNSEEICLNKLSTV